MVYIILAIIFAGMLAGILSLYMAYRGNDSMTAGISILNIGALLIFSVPILPPSAHKAFAEYPIQAAGMSVIVLCPAAFLCSYLVLRSGKLNRKEAVLFAVSFICNIIVTLIYAKVLWL